MRKKTFRLLAMLALCMVVVCSFFVTAFAYAEDTEQDLPVTEATQPEETPKPDPEPEEVPETITPGEPIDDTGNAYTRDLLYDKATNKQFISIQTKNGSTFYVVVDYDAPINEEEEQYQTYFLNMVDEADLLALMDEEAVSALKTCTCSEKCVAGAIDTSCPVCKNNMSECTGTAPETEEPAAPPTEEVEEPETGGSNLGMILVVVLIVGAGGAAYYYFKFVRGKKQKDEDLDFYDDEGYEEEPYINEDEQPEFEEDEETEADKD